MTLFTPASVEYELRHWSPGSAHCQIVSASGELDLRVAPDLRELLCRLIELGGQHFVVDLSHATFIDSTAIGVLTGRLKYLRGREGSLVLVCTNEFLLRTFEIAGMDRVFEIYATLPEALARGSAR